MKIFGQGRTVEQLTAQGFTSEQAKKYANPKAPNKLAFQDNLRLRKKR